MENLMRPVQAVGNVAKGLLDVGNRENRDPNDRRGKRAFGDNVIAENNLLQERKKIDENYRQQKIKEREEEKKT